MNELGYQEWKEFCETTARRVFDNFTWFNGNNHYISKYTEAMDRRLLHDIDHCGHNHSLYMAIGYFIGFEVTRDLTVNNYSGNFFSNQYFTGLGEEIFSLFSEWILAHHEEVRLLVTTDNEDVVCVNLRKQLIQETTNENFTINANDLNWQAYVWIWKLSTPEMRIDEISRLQLLNGDSSVSEQIFYLQSIDLDAEQLAINIRNFKSSSLRKMMLLMDVSLLTEQYDLPRIIIDWVLEHIPSKIGSQFSGISIYDVRMLCQMTELYSGIQEDNFESFEKVIFHFMPYTRTEYGELLFYKRDYKRWLELQVVEGNELLTYSMEEVKVITKEAPELLLPLYHQKIASEISGKNRHSYKVAVRLMKKLRTIYKKLKMTDQWDQYVSYIEEKNKRLRAFQEELRKGKIVETIED